MTLDSVWSTPFRHGPPITPGFESAIDYVEEAKSRLENKNGRFKAFCKVLYQVPQKTFADIQQEVGSIMKGESDLVSGFRGFLPSISSVTPPRTLKIRIKRKIFDALHAVADTGPICSSTVDSPDMYAAAKRQRGTNGLVKMEDKPFEGERDEDSLPEIISSSSFDSSDGKDSSVLNREKHVKESFREIDRSKWEICTPSYRFIPKNCKCRVSNEQSNHEDLNTEVVLLPCTSDYDDRSNYKTTRNHPEEIYEERLNQNEDINEISSYKNDPRFEMDMFLEGLRSTVNRLEELIEDMEDNDSTIFTIDKLNALQLRCIRRTYMDDRIIERLCMKPKMAIPIILGRLIKKEEELEKHISYYDRFCSKLFTKRLC
ncbi:hypothetical protein QJS04_geneDACA013278 [Acorus gramineus]|uniref:Histone deacetylase interacting domain-containing protein n=1 Tax=Acorus gramineus TaxID=55184 RepID=A0AAV9BD81_ACOGR|nr:hypothetical protein QJS04_geneDACA013278 [Acorus gramineus]